MNLELPIANMCEDPGVGNPIVGKMQLKYNIAENAGNPKLDVPGHNYPTTIDTAVD